LKKVLDEEPVDFLFIDGDHSYKGVRQDFETYSKLVRPGGLIAMHDIVENPHDPTIEVSSFWQELKSETDVAQITEFVDPSATPGMPVESAGIGAIRV
jgi:predicted O-methyltransferase YrrM